MKMRMEYDKSIDAAYLYIKDKISKGEIMQTIALNDNIILDFDKNRRLIGIEILSASEIIPREGIKGALVATRKIS